jgi:hypothetical protein
VQLKWIEWLTSEGQGEILNYRSKILYPLVFASLFVIGSVAQAAVYDFGSTLKVSPSFTAAPNSFTQQATPVAGFEKLAFEPSINEYLPGWSGQDVMSDSKRFDFVPDQSTRKPATSLIDSSVLLPVVYIDVQGAAVADAARYQPVAVVPEPETFLMLLSGFGLLCYSARRRKTDTFD